MSAPQRPTAIVNVRNPEGKLVMPPFYIPPLQMPLYWRDEQSGQLPAAVNAYLSAYIGEGPEPTPYQLEMLCAFSVYFINAPCWEENLQNQDCEDMLDELRQLRERAKELASFESIRRWTCEAMELGLDPW